MSFPNLTPTPLGVAHGSGTGIPENGINEFDCGIDLELYDKLLVNGPFQVDTWLVVRVWALGPSVLNANYAGRNGNRIRVNFQQVGVDQCFVETEFTHSIIR